MLLSNKIKDKALQSTILLFSIVTIIVLVLIVGYTVFRGFYSETVSLWKEIPKGETSIVLDGKEYFVIVNEKLKINELSIEKLLSIKKGRTKNWGLITGQDIKIKVYAIARDSIELTKQASYQESAFKLKSAVHYTDGAIGFLPMELAEDFNGVNILPIRRIVLAVNRSVVESVHNKRLREIPGEKVYEILKGSISNWIDLGGIDLPFRIVVPPENSSIFRGVNRNYFDVLETSINSIHASSKKHVLKILSDTPGSVTPIDYREAVELGLPILTILDKKSGKNISWDFIINPPKKSGKVGGVSTIILNTIIMIILTLLFTVPIGIGAAIYLTMYSDKGQINNIIRIGVETLAGVPSIIFGLFGFIVFVELLGLGTGLLSGTLTISLMILPTIIRTSEEAIKTVPESYYAGSLALGATKWQSVSRVIVPAASTGIISGVILGMGRAVGETAALLFTMGSDYRLVPDLTSPARVLSVHLYMLVKEGISFERGFATATILIVVILIMNLSTTFIINRIGGAGEKK